MTIMSILQRAGKEVEAKGHIIQTYKNRAPRSNHHYPPLCDIIKKRQLWCTTSVCMNRSVQWYKQSQHTSFLSCFPPKISLIFKLILFSIK